jgi:hypothetical protein
LDWQIALELAQADDIGDAKTYASVVHGERFVLGELWRAALVSQMLTPAPDVNAVAWKRAVLSGGQPGFVSVAPETLHKAIADDVQWLNDHPTRRRAGR